MVVQLRNWIELEMENFFSFLPVDDNMEGGVHGGEYPQPKEVPTRRISSPSFTLTARFGLFCLVFLDGHSVIVRVYHVILTALFRVGSTSKCELSAPRTRTLADLGHL